MMTMLHQDCPSTILSLCPNCGKHIESQNFLEGQIECPNCSSKVIPIYLGRRASYMSQGVVIIPDFSGKNLGQMTVQYSRSNEVVMMNSISYLQVSLERYKNLNDTATIEQESLGYYLLKDGKSIILNPDNLNPRLINQYPEKLTSQSESPWSEIIKSRNNGLVILSRIRDSLTQVVYCHRR